MRRCLRYRNVSGMTCSMICLHSLLDGLSDTQDHTIHCTPEAAPHLCLFSLPSAAGAGRFGAPFAFTAAGDMGALPLLLLRAVCDVRNPPGAFSGTRGALPPVPLRAVCLTRAYEDRVQSVNEPAVELHQMSAGCFHVAVQHSLN